MLYDMTLKFESKVFVKTFDKDFDELLTRMGCRENSIGKTATISHTMQITGSPVIPNEDFIEKSKESIFQCLAETLMKNNNINAEVREVNFIGITKLKEREE